MGIDEGKLYYSISEVAEISGLEPYVLRFWEKEFPQLHPKKNRAGNRTYQAKDIEVIKSIKKLLYDDGFTIEGARNILKKGATEETSSEPTKERLHNLLVEVKGELDDLLKLFP